MGGPIFRYARLTKSVEAYPMRQAQARPISNCARLYLVWFGFYDFVVPAIVPNVIAHIAVFAREFPVLLIWLIAGIAHSTPETGAAR